MSLLQLKIRVGEAIKDCDLMSTETVGLIKQKLFQAEVTQGAQIRLFFAGRELRDGSTASAVGLVNGSVVHAVINRTPGPGQSGASTARRRGDAGNLESMVLVFLLGLILLALWYAALATPEYFGLLSWIVLLGFTALHISYAHRVFVTSRRPSPP